MALPAVCGQTGKPLLMVVRPHGRAILELIRAVAIAARPPVAGLPVRRSGPPHPTQCCVPNNATPSRATGGAISEEVSFQPLNIRARIHISDLYDGCPYCRARGYFHCCYCGLFSCWNSHNQRTHFDHTDIWCEACQLWRCTSQNDDDNSLTEVTAYAARGNTIDPRSRIYPGSTRRDRIDRSTSIRGYLG
jgi:hypothetical protein